MFPESRKDSVNRARGQAILPAPRRWTTVSQTPGIARRGSVSTNPRPLDLREQGRAPGVGPCDESGRRMNPDRWESAKRLFHDALERAPDDRDRFVRDAAADDEELRAEVLALLSAQTRADAAFRDVARSQTI